MRDIFEQFEFDTQVDRLAKANLPYLATERFAGIARHPDDHSNAIVTAIDIPPETEAARRRTR